MNDFTASKRGLLQHCSRWTLPGCTWIEIDRPEYEVGTDFHALIQAYVDQIGQPKPGTLGPFANASARAIQMFNHAERWLLQRRAVGVTFNAEQKMCWNILTDTARFLSSKVHRDYTGKTPDEVCGTFDLCEFEGGDVIIIDWLSTHPGGDPPDKVAQLRTLGLFAARVFDVQRIGIRTVIVNENGCYPSEVVWLDAIALDAECDALRAELSQDPAPRPGPHCKERRCPAIGSCEAHQDTAAELVPADALTQYKVTAEITSKEHAYWLLVATDIIEEKLAPIRKRLREWADANGGIDDGRGRTWSSKWKGSETPQLDVPGAVDIVREAGAEAALELSTSWAAIERAVGEDAALKIRAALRAHGATKAGGFPEFRWRKVKIGKQRAA